MHSSTKRVVLVALALTLSVTALAIPGWHEERQHRKTCEHHSLTELVEFMKSQEYKAAVGEADARMIGPR